MRQHGDSPHHPIAANACRNCLFLCDLLSAMCSIRLEMWRKTRPWLVWSARERARQRSRTAQHGAQGLGHDSLSLLSRLVAHLLFALCFLRLPDPLSTNPYPNMYFQEPMAQSPHRRRQTAVRQWQAMFPLPPVRLLIHLWSTSDTTSKAQFKLIGPVNS